MSGSFSTPAASGLVALAGLAILDRFEEAVILKDHRGETLYFNAAAAALFASEGIEKPPTGSVREHVAALAMVLTEPERFTRQLNAVLASPDATLVEKYQFARTGDTLKVTTRPVLEADHPVARICFLRRETTTPQPDVHHLAMKLREAICPLAGFAELLRNMLSSADAVEGTYDEYLSHIFEAAANIERIATALDDGRDIPVYGWPDAGA